MNKGCCTKNFIEKFIDRAIIDKDGYCLYKKRDDGCVVLKNGVELDIRFVVPYNFI